MSSLPRLILGNSPAMREARRLAEFFAPTDLPIVLLGERGTGKSAFATHLHQASGRTGEFVEERLGALPEQLQYGALAGHARGSFTGAFENRKGLVESAHQGTLFLDEIGLASPDTQRLLLGLLDNGALRRLGDDRRRRLDVRLLFATNRDLKQMADEGQFRADLLDRFGYQFITMPPLRERRDEILALAQHFVSRESTRQTSGHSAWLGAEVLELFQVAPWPGNIRQLENACRFAVAIAGQSPVIEPKHLPSELIRELTPSLSAGDDPDSTRLRQALALVDGNKSEAARLLGISRPRLYRLLAAQN